jgi:hypothetical protein
VLAFVDVNGTCVHGESSTTLSYPLVGGSKGIVGVSLHGHGLYAGRKLKAKVDLFKVS